MLVSYSYIIRIIVHGIHSVGSEENESDEMVERSKALASCERIGPVPGSNPHNVHTI